MANSYVEYTTAGSGTNGLGQTTFTAPPQFLSINDIRVKGYNGSSWTELTISSRGTTTVTLSAAPTSGSYSKIRVFRSSTTEALIDFQNGSRLAESDLDTAYRQSLFVAQEVAEVADPDGGSGVGNIVSSQLQLPLTNFSSTGIDDNATSNAITIDSSERVGISNSSPVEMLTIGKTSDSASRIQFLGATNGANTIHFGDGTSADAYRGYINYAHDTDSLQFASGGAERMRISSDGSTLFGCTSLPSASVVGSAFHKTLYDMELLLSTALTTGNNIVEFYNPNGIVGQIVTNGSSTAYQTSSDYRLKENLDYDFDATNRLKQLKPCRFNFIADANTTVDGFLAHEVQSVVPEAISGTKDAVDAEGNPDYQGIDQSKLVPLLVKTIQELEARITALETA